MQQTIQSLSALERRVDLTVPAAAIEQEVKTRLAKLARDMQRDQFIVVNLSGRGDKDMQTVATIDGITL